MSSKNFDPDDFPETWTWKNGRQLRVGDMDEKDVREALNWILRGARVRRELSGLVLETLHDRRHYDQR